MKWTKDTPTQEGWYWWKREPENNPSVRHVWGDPEDLMVWSRVDGGNAAGGYWYGPIEAPGRGE